MAAVQTAMTQAQFEQLRIRNQILTIIDPDATPLSIPPNSLRFPSNPDASEYFGFYYDRQSSAQWGTLASTEISNLEKIQIAEVLQIGQYSGSFNSPLQGPLQGKISLDSLNSPRGNQPYIVYTHRYMNGKHTLLPLIMRAHNRKIQGRPQIELNTMRGYCGKVTLPAKTMYEVNLFSTRTIALLGDETMQSIAKKAADNPSNIRIESYNIKLGTSAPTNIIIDGLKQTCFRIPLINGGELIVPDMVTGEEIWDSPKEFHDKRHEFAILGTYGRIPMIYTVADYLREAKDGKPKIDATGWYSDAIKSVSDGCSILLDPIHTGLTYPAIIPRHVIRSDTMRQIWMAAYHSRQVVTLNDQSYRISELPFCNYMKNGELIRPGLIENLDSIMTQLIDTPAKLQAFINSIDENAYFFQNEMSILDSINKRIKILDRVADIQRSWGYDPSAGWFQGQAARTQQFWYNQIHKHEPRPPLLNIEKLLNECPNFNIFTMEGLPSGTSFGRYLFQDPASIGETDPDLIGIYEANEKMSIVFKYLEQYCYQFNTGTISFNPQIQTTLDQF